MPDFACRFPQACGKTCMHGTDRNLDDATSALEDTRPRRPLHPHVIPAKAGMTCRTPEQARYLHGDDAASHGDRHCMGSVARVKFGHDALHVSFDRLFGNTQRLGNELVGVASRYA